MIILLNVAIFLLTASMMCLTVIAVIDIYRARARQRAAWHKIHHDHDFDNE